MTSLIPVYLKTIYKDEPVYRGTKVVYSIFDKEFEQQLGKDFTRKASLNAVPDNHLECFAHGDHCSLQIGAITHSDAIVQVGTTVDPAISKHISDKPFMQHSDDQQGDQYASLYDQLCNR
jgi:starch synthase